MNLRALRYLIALAECLNFSRAADRCAVTQSTLSIQLRKLEDYLGVALFDRTRARVSLTPEGGEVLRLAREAVAAADRIICLCRSSARARALADSPAERPAA
jgi:DNA-binding transcriptional LysR family regulator